MAEVPAGLRIPRVELRDLPDDWRRVDHPELQRLGTDWMESLSSLALLVPSAAVEGEWNVLLNPLHSDFRKIRISGPKPFHYDERMFWKQMC